jgi:hypothetical protein
VIETIPGISPAVRNVHTSRSTSAKATNAAYTMNIAMISPKESFFSGIELYFRHPLPVDFAGSAGTCIDIPASLDEKAEVLFGELSIGLTFTAICVAMTP